MHPDRRFDAGRSRAYVRAGAVDVQDENSNVLIMVAYALASAIVLFWLVHLSLVNGTALSKLNILSEHASYNELVNRLHKADRLPTAPFNDRWNASISSSKPDATRRIGRIPDGCEPAFSGLVKASNFSSRCVT
jgi:hypothetical protein